LKPAPRTATQVDPNTGPARGLTLATDAGDSKANVAARWAWKSTPLFVTRTATVPGPCRGEAHVRASELTKVAAAMTSPKAHASVAELRKLVPVTCTVAPPADMPNVGATLSTVTLGA